MANDSSTGGYVGPVAESPPLEDSALDALFQGAVSAVSGISGEYVRPRWQPVMPKQPEPGTDWAAIGITEVSSDDGPVLQHVGSNVGQVGEVGRDDYIRHESITLLCTFYGPNGQRNATRARDGVHIPQNLDTLKANGVGFIESGPVRSVPELYNQQWIRRYDLELFFRRKVYRAYPILNILTADPVYTTDTVIITDGD